MHCTRPGRQLVHITELFNSVFLHSQARRHSFLYVQELSFNKVYGVGGSSVVTGISPFLLFFYPHCSAFLFQIHSITGPCNTFRTLIYTNNACWCTTIDFTKKYYFYRKTSRNGLLSKALFEGHFSNMTDQAVKTRGGKVKIYKITVFQSSW